MTEWAAPGELLSSIPNYTSQAPAMEFVLSMSANRRDSPGHSVGPWLRAHNVRSRPTHPMCSKYPGGRFNFVVT